MGFASRNPYCAQDDRANLESKNLFRNHAAGDAVAGSASGIGFVIVGLGVDDDGGTAVAEERVGVGAEVYVFIFDLGVGFALGIDGEVFHVAGVVAFGIVESMLFAVGIEVRTGGFEVRCNAARILMEVNSVLAGGKAVKMQLEGNGRSLLRDENGADVLALGIFEFDFGFSGAGKRGDDQDGDEEEPWIFHAGNYSECGCTCTNVPCLIHRGVEYTAKKFGIPSGKWNHGFECGGAGDGAGSGG